MTRKELDTQRPITRGDCLAGGINEQRPCPWISCAYHLGPEQTAFRYIKKDRKLSFRQVDKFIKSLEKMKYTCALDAIDAKQYGLSLGEISELFGVTKQRVAQIENSDQYGETKRKYAGGAIQKCRRFFRSAMLEEFVMQ